MKFFAPKNQIVEEYKKYLNNLEKINDKKNL